MSKYIKLLLAILLFICLLNMPYGFYQLVRFIATIGFCILAFKTYNHQSRTATVIYVSLALLFQPFFKIALGREIWNIVDVFVGIGLILSLVLNRNNY